MNVTEEDEGKQVVNKAGKRVGMVSKVERHSVHVDPDPGITDKIKSKLGWGDSDDDTYTIKQSDVSSVNEDSVRLRR